MSHKQNDILSRLSVVYATDDNYAQHVAVSIVSLLKARNKTTQYELFLLGNNLTVTNRSNLTSIAEQYNTKIQFIDISTLYERLPKDIDVANLSISTYSRLFLADLLPINIDRVLYLDCDTLVMQDLSVLTDYPMMNISVLGVEDMMYPEMKIKIGLKSDDKYINAGVLLINLKRWRETSATSRFLSFINGFNGKVPHLDQGVINGVLLDRGILPLKYNVQSPIYAIHRYMDLLKFHSLNSYYSPQEFLAAKEMPVVIHYTSFFVERPWFKFCLHPHKDLYRKFLRETPYAGYSLQNNKYGWSRKMKMILFHYIQPLYLIAKYNCK